MRFHTDHLPNLMQHNRPYRTWRFQAKNGGLATVRLDLVDCRLRPYSRLVIRSGSPVAHPGVYLPVRRAIVQQARPMVPCAASVRVDLTHGCGLASVKIG